ncbi:major facilitator superfamily domain-containing protein [Dipodascopsis uninucleata]
MIEQSNQRQAATVAQSLAGTRSETDIENNKELIKEISIDEFQESEKDSLISVLGVVLISAQFSLDTTTYLTSVISLINSIKPDREAHYLYVTQAVSAAVQVIASFLVGYIASYCRSVKYVLIICFLFSVTGNMVYSSSGVKALDSIGALIGGRALTGIGSASAALAYSYIVLVAKSSERSYKYFKIFRASGAIFMTIGQILSIALSYCNFYIKGYKINSSNAPTYGAAFLIFLLSIALVFILENPRPKAPLSPLAIVKRLYGTNHRTNQSASSISTRVKPVLILLNGFISTFVIASQMYFLPIFYSLRVGWSDRNQSINCIIILVVSTVLSIVYQNFLKSCLRTSNTSNAIYFENRIMGIISNFMAIIGMAIMLAIWKAYGSHNGRSNKNFGFPVAFSIGITLGFTGYNTQAGCIPSLFKSVVKPELQVVIMPFLGISTGIGKLLAPIIIGAIYASPAGAPMGIGLALICGTFAIALFYVI